MNSGNSATTLAWPGATAVAASRPYCHHSGEPASIMVRRAPCACVAGRAWRVLHIGENFDVQRENSSLWHVARFRIQAPRRRRLRSQGRMIFSVRLDCFLTAVAVSPTLGAAPQAISLRHIEFRILPPRQVRFELRCAGRSFTAAGCVAVRCLVRSRNDCTAPKPARRLLIFCSTSCANRASVVGNGALMLRRLRLQGLQSSPPPAPYGLRGVAVVAAR